MNLLDLILGFGGVDVADAEGVLVGAVDGAVKAVGDQVVGVGVLRGADKPGSAMTGVSLARAHIVSQIPQIEIKISGTLHSYQRWTSLSTQCISWSFHQSQGSLQAR